MHRFRGSQWQPLGRRQAARVLGHGQCELLHAVTSSRRGGCVTAAN